MPDVPIVSHATNLATLAADVFDAPVAVIHLQGRALSDDRVHGLAPERFAEMAALCERALAGPDGEERDLAALLPAHPMVAGPPHLRSCVATAFHDVVAGAICVFGPDLVAQPSAGQRRQLGHVADLVVAQDRAARKNAELERLHVQALRASRMLRSAMEAADVSAALTRLVAELCRYHGATVGRIWKLNLPEASLQEISRFEDDDLDDTSYYRKSANSPLSPKNSFTARVIETNEPRYMLYSEIENPGDFGILGAAISSGLKCQVSYPIWLDDQRFGVAMSFSTERHDLAEVMADIAALADTIRPALYRKVTEERLQLLSLALNATNDAMLITEAGDMAEPAPRILYANPSFYRMTGYSEVEVLGRSPRLLQGPATDRAVTRQVGARLRHNQTARAEVENYRRDGSRFWVEMEITPIADGTNAPTHLVSVQRDVTARRHEQQIILQSEKLKTIGQLTGGVAHDFNNLLTVVTLNLDMALTEMALDDPLQELLQPAMRAASRGIDLTQQLLSYARRSWLRPQPLPVSSLFDSLQPLLKRTVSAQYALMFNTDPSPAHTEAARVRGCVPVSAMVDPGQLDNALLNLVINARDAMPTGGAIRLDASVVSLATVQDGLRDEMAPGRYVCIQVQDEGTGIPPEVLGRVFDPFFTTKDVGKGTGLGLSMVYGFAKQTGGTAAISSEPGLGTTVTLFLPVHDIPA